MLVNVLSIIHKVKGFELQEEAGLKILPTLALDETNGGAFHFLLKCIIELNEDRYPEACKELRGKLREDLIV